MPATLFEFVVAGVPRTPSSRSRRSWQDKVRDAAIGRWPQNQEPFEKELSATIVYYYSEETQLDVDNIIKPVLDALKGVVFKDDNVISQVLARKSNQVGLTISEPPRVLADALGKFQSFLYVRLGDAPQHDEFHNDAP